MNNGLLIAICSLIGAWAGSYIKSFLSETAKNDAALKAIEKLTDITENIKTDLARETNRLSSEIQLSNQVHFSIKSEQIKTIIDLHEKHFTWFNTLTGNLIIDHLVIGNPQAPYDYCQKLDVLQTSVSIALSKAELFLLHVDHSFLVKALKLRVETSQLQAEVFTLINQFDTDLKRGKSQSSVSEYYKTYSDLVSGKPREFFDLHLNFNSDCYALLQTLTIFHVKN